MRKLFWLIMVIMLALPFIPTAAAEDVDNTGYRCRLNDHTVFPRYERDNQRLVLVSWNTGEDIEVLETGFTPFEWHIYGFSPNCQYFMAGLGAVNSMSVMIWNIRDNQRVGAIEGLNGFFPQEMIWSPDGQHLVMALADSTYLWTLPTDRSIKISSVRGVSRVRWDEARNQLLYVARETNGGVTALDLASGEQVGFYHLAGRGDRVNYTLSGNEVMVVNGTNGTSLALWNRDTGENMQFDTSGGWFITFPEGSIRWTYSPDGRYLAISNRDIHVYDLHNLGAEPYLPVTEMKVNEKYYPHLRFAGDMIEAVAVGRNWYIGTYMRAYRWDLAGNRLYSAWYYEDFCYDLDFAYNDPDPALLSWGCEIAGLPNPY